MLRPHLNERQWRLLLGAEAEAIGRGGIALVARLSGASRTTVQAGAAEIVFAVAVDDEVIEPVVDRSGREGLSGEQEDRVAAVERGWVPAAVGVQNEGGLQHPDRDAQFRHINATAQQFLDAGDPVIYVDTKKKELVGEYANKGREWQPTSQPVPVNGHGFPQPQVPRAIPYGVYDLAANDGFVSVGIDHDTAEFAVNPIGLWWDRIGKARYPQATRLMITADSGGSNGNRLCAWKVELANLAAATGLEITVCHFPGTSKWNKIEYRLFSFVSIKWRGRPLTDYQVVVETIAATTTDTGLTVQAVRDQHRTPPRIRTR